MNGKDAATLKLEAIRTALTIAAGIGAAATLLLAFRRQSTSEQAQHFTERDAQEQRITELYVAAASQLGSDKAAVRLAGLYALERIGQNNPHMRQTVVDVICAYLRMPYTPPRHITQLGSAPKSARVRTTPAQRADILRQRTEQQQEFQVRQTAQRLLAAHTNLLNPNQEPEAFWRTPQRHPMDLDLARATLTDFNLSHCHVGNLDLNHANLHGDTSMFRSQFHGDAVLTGARFHGDAHLSRAQFNGVAYLTRAWFHGDAVLTEARFHGHADLGGAQFHGVAYLTGAWFHDLADLRAAQFHDVAYLNAAQFYRRAYLGEAQFRSAAYLHGAQFRGDPFLVGARFKFDEVLPHGWKLVPAQESELPYTVIADDEPDSREDEEETAD